MIDSIAKVAGSVASWLDPDRKEEHILRGAIEAAEQLIMIYENEGKYKDISEKRKDKLKIHYRKRFNSWKDGRT